MTTIKHANILHRDLKLQNIMIHFTNLEPQKILDPNFDLNKYVRNCPFDENLVCKITDLGISRKLEVDQLAGSSCGTITFMAPEVLGGNLYGHKADVWSFGVLFFQMITGFLPFDGDNMIDFIEKLKQGKY